VKHLVYFEVHPTMESAIAREKQIKEWKLALIERDNPNWVDRYDGIAGAKATTGFRLSPE
jgi:putative endonuclease